METYKLYRLYEKQKSKTVKQLEILYPKRQIHYPAELLVAIGFNENQHTWKEIFDKMVHLDVSQAMFTLSVMKRLIYFFGVEKCPISIEFTEDIADNTLLLVNGYLERIQKERNEPLRKDDLRHFLSLIHELSEVDIDVKGISVTTETGSFQVLNNGVVTASSKEVFDHIVDIAFNRG